jgi:hypothetical protein
MVIPAARSRPLRIAIILGLCLVVGFYQLRVESRAVFPRTHIPQKHQEHLAEPLDMVVQSKAGKKKPGAKTEPWRVPLEAHIMSKCPDAKDCIIDLVVPTMSQLDPAMVNFTLSYIGQPTDGDDGVSCKHGPNECLGNILQLCAASLYPDPKQNLGFAMCMEKQYELIPRRTLIEECAAEYGLEFDKLNDCASKEHGGFGIGLLRDSVRRSLSAGATISCTVSHDRLMREGERPEAEAERRLTDYFSFGK